MSTDQVAIITGCGRSDGIGAGIARRLAADGMAVAVTDLPGGVGSDSLDELAADLTRDGRSALACRGDVSSESDTSTLVDDVAGRLGRVTVLVNNAGAPHGPDRAPISEVPIDAWNRQLDVNLTGAFLMIRGVLPQMLELGYGRIVNIASAVALVGMKERAAYTSSKAAILGLTRAVAAEGARRGVTVNAICPGAIATARALATASREQGTDSVDEGLAARAAATPVSRMGTPADIAAAVAFLVSVDAGFITGQVLVVDGGATTLNA